MGGTLSVDARNGAVSDEAIAAFFRTHELKDAFEEADRLDLGLTQIAEATGQSVGLLEAEAEKAGYTIEPAGAGTPSGEGGVAVLQAAGQGDQPSSGTENSTTTAVRSGVTGPGRADHQPSSSPNAVELSPMSATSVREAIYGEGNEEISQSEIRGYLESRWKNPYDVAVYFAVNKVNAKQVGEALGLSERQVTAALLDYGLDENSLRYAETKNYIPISQSSAETVFSVLYGPENKKILDEDIRAWFGVVPRSPKEILDQMVEHGVSAAQFARALGLSGTQLQVQLVEWGLTPKRLAEAVVGGMDSPKFEALVASMEKQRDEVLSSSSALGGEIDRLNLLMDQVRVAEDQAAEDKAAYDALNAKFAPAFTEYSGYTSEVAALEGLINNERQLIAQSQDTLANLHKINKKRGRRETARVGAEAQIASSNQKIADAEARLAVLRGKMKEMEVWGIPLMQQTETAKARYEKSAQAALDSVDVALAQHATVRAAGDKSRAEIAELTFKQQVIGLWLKDTPGVIQSSDEVDRVLKASADTLKEVMAQQRGWVEAARQRGLKLEADAVQLDKTVNEIKARLSQKMPAARQAQAEIDEKQRAYNDARDEEARVEASLEAAYAQRVEADNAGGKGARNRARDEANRLIKLFSEDLARARQARLEAEAALNKAQEDGKAAIAASAEVEAEWMAAAARASNARSQSLAQLGIGTDLFGMESASTTALMSTYALMIDSGKNEVQAAKDLAASGKISLDQLGAIEDRMQASVKYALAGIGDLEKDAADLRVAAENERQAYVQLQAEAWGKRLIASSESADHDYLKQNWDAMVDLPRVRADFAAAEQRLFNAKRAVEMADMRMDWAEGRINAKGQARDMEKARPAIDAAEKELQEAQKAYDDAKAALDQADKFLNDPLRNLSINSACRATSANLDAEQAELQAQTVAGWAGISQARFSGVDGVLTGMQGMVLEATQGASVLQMEMAKLASVPEAAQLLNEQAAASAKWASDYERLVGDIRKSESQTYVEQAKLDQLKIEAVGQIMLAGHLKTKAVELEPVYQAALGALAGLESTFDASSNSAFTDAQAAEVARNRMIDAELESMVAFVMSRNQDGTLAKNGQPRRDASITVESFYGKAVETLTTDAFNQRAVMLLTAEAQQRGIAQPELTNEQVEKLASELKGRPDHGVNTNFTPEQVHRTAMQLFVDKAQQDAMAKRPTLRKQLHYVDDRQIWIDADPKVKAARDAALGVEKLAEQSSQKAIDDGHALMVARFIAKLQGNRLVGANADWRDSAQAAADTTLKLSQQADVLAGSYNAEKAAHDAFATGVTAYASESAVLGQRISVEAAKTSSAGDLRNLLLGQSQDLTAAESAYEPLVGTANVLSGQFTDLAADAGTIADTYEKESADWKKVADEAKTQFQQVKTRVDADTKALESADQKTIETMSKNYSLKEWATAVVREHADKVKDAKELHEDRVVADQVYKKQKKKALLKMLITGLISVAVMAAAMFVVAPALIGGLQSLAMSASCNVGVMGSIGAALTTGTQLTALGSFVIPGLAGAITGAGASLVSQGINGAIYGDKINLGQVGISAMSLGLTRGIMAFQPLARAANWLSTQTQVGRGFSQAVNSVLGVEVAGNAASAARPLLGFLRGAPIDPRQLADAAAIGIQGAAANFGVQTAMKWAGIQDKYIWTDVIASGMAYSLLAGWANRLAGGKIQDLDKSVKGVAAQMTSDITIDTIASYVNYGGVGLGTFNMSDIVLRAVASNLAAGVDGKYGPGSAYDESGLPVKPTGNLDGSGLETKPIVDFQNGIDGRTAPSQIVSADMA